MESNGGSAGLITGILYLVLIAVYIVSFWKLFTKAGKPGWVGIVPIYNMYVLLQLVGRPGWWLLLYFVPGINIVVSLINSVDLAKSFGRSEAFGIIALFLFSFVGYPMLGLGKATYQGPSVKPKTAQPLPAQSSPAQQQPVNQPQQVPPSAQPENPPVVS